MTETNSLISSFPLPPAEYYRNYSNELVNAGFAPEPPPVFTDSYDSFGVRMNENDPIIRPLESQGIERLYADTDDNEDLYKGSRDYRYELRKLNHSILASYLDLLYILANAPQSPAREEKLNDLTVIFLNMHHLINCMRPHQATETIRVILEAQKRQRYEAVQRFQLHIERVVKVLNFELYDNVPEDKLISYAEYSNESLSDVHMQSIASEEDASELEDDSEILPFLCDVADCYVQEFHQNNLISS